MVGRPRKGVTLQQRFEEKFVVADSGCWEWTGTRHRHAGYGQFRLGPKMIYAHRASWVIYNGQPPQGLHILHRCDNRLCVNPGHLFLGTNDENMADMVAKGRQAQRERHGRSKLTGEQVKAIRGLGGKMLQREIAAMFGIRQQQVSHILRGVHWSDPDPDLASYHSRYRRKEAA